MTSHELPQKSGLRAFLWIPFLRAFNANKYRMLVSLRAVHIAAQGGTDYLALACAMFVIRSCTSRVSRCKISKPYDEAQLVSRLFRFVQTLPAPSTRTIKGKAV